MAIIRCKMCGGDLEVQEGVSSCICDFCGTQQTIPTVNDEGLQALFNRANVLRMKSEFDKASDIYEKILQKNESEAEAYWGLILCKYGIEYVEDPATLKRIPTCHRATYDAVTADEDYKNALKYADVIQKQIYEAEAKAIDEIQKGIIALAQKADLYDVFICYKESDEEGKRTQDSAIANDIYHQLTQEGYKVFYAAISLEDKLGKEYEPYIFSALNTAKVMLSIGTKPEYFNAVWVKNEWSRFLKIMKKDHSKLLIPCYKGMDPYELPDEFAHLQAQDMNKIGFINDLIRGIKKVIVKEEQQTPVQSASVQPTQTVAAAPVYATNVSALLKRGDMALEDHEWKKADEFYEEVLNQNAECAEAYLGKFMAEKRIIDLSMYVYLLEGSYEDVTKKKLTACSAAEEHIEKIVGQYELEGFLKADAIRKLYEFNFSYMSSLEDIKFKKMAATREMSREKNLSRAKQYASGELAERIDAIMAKVNTIFDEKIKDAEKENQENVNRIKDEYSKHLSAADAKAKELYDQACAQKEARYQRLVDEFSKTSSQSGFEKLKNNFLAFKNYKESEQFVVKCQKELDRVTEENQRESQREANHKKIVAVIAAIIVVAIIGISVFVVKIVVPNVKYNAAVKMKDSGKYAEAIEAFEAMDDYKDSADLISACQTALKDIDYNTAVSLMNEGKIIDAYESFVALNGYKDSSSKASEISALYVNEKLKIAAIGDIVFFGTYEQNNNTSDGKENIEWIVLEKENGKALIISQYALDSQKYDTSGSSITWEKCSLRTWLNGTFLNNAFSTEEQERIASTYVSADENLEYSTNPGNATDDKVFLFSITEVEEYFSSDSARQCEPTQYAVANGHNIKYDNGNCSWWLRSPGSHQNTAGNVDVNGGIVYHGNSVGNQMIAVRPALWINLEP